MLRIFLLRALVPLWHNLFAAQLRKKFLLSIAKSLNIFMSASLLTPFFKITSIISNFPAFVYSSPAAPVFPMAQSFLYNSAQATWG